MSTSPPPGEQLAALTDAELARRACNDGRRRAEPFTVLTARQAKGLLLYFRARTPARAEDLVQETFLRMWRTICGFRHDNFRAWMMSAARSAWQDSAALAANRHPAAGGDDEGPVADHDDTGDPLSARSEFVRAVREALGRLTAQERALIERYDRYGGDLSHDELCRELGVHPRQGYRLREHAQKRLELELRRQGHELPVR